MKRHWIVAENGIAVASEWGSGFSKYHTEAEAEKRARALAEENPGTRYSVFALISSFVVNVMTEERAQ